MLNNCTIMGRLVRDPELRRTNSGIACTSFTLACERDFGGDDKVTDFIDCVAWRQTAEFIDKYFAKGRMMIVNGSLTIRSWTDKDNHKRKNAEILVDHAYFADSKSDSGTVPTAHTQENNFDAMPDDDEGQLPW